MSENRRKKRIFLSDSEDDEDAHDQQLKQAKIIPKTEIVAVNSPKTVCNSSSKRNKRVSRRDMERAKILKELQVRCALFYAE